MGVMARRLVSQGLILVLATSSAPGGSAATAEAAAPPAPRSAVERRRPQGEAARNAERRRGGGEEERRKQSAERWAPTVPLDQRQPHGRTVSPSTDGAPAEQEHFRTYMKSYLPPGDYKAYAESYTGSNASWNSFMDRYGGAAGNYTDFISEYGGPKADYGSYVSLYSSMAGENPASGQDWAQKRGQQLDAWNKSMTATMDKYSSGPGQQWANQAMQTRAGGGGDGPPGKDYQRYAKDYEGITGGGSGYWNGPAGPEGGGTPSGAYPGQQTPKEQASWGTSPDAPSSNAPPGGVGRNWMPDGVIPQGSIPSMPASAPGGEQHGDVGSTGSGGADSGGFDSYGAGYDQYLRQYAGFGQRQPGQGQAGHGQASPKASAPSGAWGTAGGDFTGYYEDYADYEGHTFARNKDERPAFDFLSYMRAYAMQNNSFSEPGHENDASRGAAPLTRTTVGGDAPAVETAPAALPAVDAPALSTPTTALALPPAESMAALTAADPSVTTDASVHSPALASSAKHFLQNSLHRSSGVDAPHIVRAGSGQHAEAAGGAKAGAHQSGKHAGERRTVHRAVSRATSLLEVSASSSPQQRRFSFVLLAGIGAVASLLLFVVITARRRRGRASPVVMPEIMLG